MFFVRWAFVKDEDVYQTMMAYIENAEMGIAREVQLRALKLIKAMLRGNSTEIFEHAYNKMSNRWRGLSNIMALSKRFSIQEIPPRFCNFFEQVREASPGTYPHIHTYTFNKKIIAQFHFRSNLMCCSLRMGEMRKRRRSGLPSSP